MITHPDDGDHPDGLNWLTLDKHAKNSYICGFIEGLFQGHCFTTWGLPGELENDPAYINATRSFDDHWNRFIANADYLQFLEGLDTLYADERNSKIEIQHGMWITMNQIAGLSQLKLETMIAAWREKDGK